MKFNFEVFLKILTNKHGLTLKTLLSKCIVHFTLKCFYSRVANDRGEIFFFSKIVRENIEISFTIESTMNSDPFMYNDFQKLYWTLNKCLEFSSSESNIQSSMRQRVKIKSQVFVKILKKKKKKKKPSNPLESQRRRRKVSPFCYQKNIWK